MAMNKEDYAQEGRRNAQDRADPTKLVAPHPFEEPAKGEKSSWQARAYWEAFYDETERLGGENSPKEPVKDWAVWKDGTPTKGDTKGHGIYAPPNFQGWPAAAAEHARKLADDIFEGKGSPQRLTRLLRKLDVLRIRHAS